MPLPNAEQAVVEIQKLREYCLNPDHPRGKHKARVFESALGLTREDAEQLRSALLTAIREEKAEQLFEDEYGTRYRLDFQMDVDSSRAEISSIWIVRLDETFPKLVTCYIR
mgnify:CR=1 FL=1